MKKIILFLMCAFLMCGCSKNNYKNIVEELNKKIEKTNSYQITALLEIFRNEEKFTYDVISTYKKGEFFKVELTNRTNQHNQIILKNDDSVYVITPSLNKTFKFQSEWPYNNSQIYLLQPIGQVEPVEKYRPLKRNTKQSNQHESFASLFQKATQKHAANKKNNSVTLLFIIYSHNKKKIVTL